MKAALEVIPGSPRRSWSYWQRNEPSFDFAWHYHGEIELTYIRAGAGQRFVGTSVARYEPGDIVLVGSETPHTWASDSAGPHRAIVCQFSIDFLGPAVLSTPEFAEIRRLLFASDAGLQFEASENRDVIDRLEAMEQEPGPRRTISLLDLLERLAQRPAKQLGATGSRDFARQSNERVRGALEAIHERYDRSLSISDVAREFSLTTDAMSRMFRRTVGRSFTDYVNDVRCAAASKLLVESERSVSAIAAACGYGNLANFNRRFRERFDCSPREYRARHTRAECHLSRPDQ